MDLCTDKFAKFLIKLKDGYSIAKAYCHSTTHVVDSMQGIHFFLGPGRVEKQLKP